MCVVPLANFYYDILVASNVAILGFLACNAYTLAWVAFPRLSPFHRMMQQCLRHVDRAISLEKAGRTPPLFTHCLPMVETAEPFFDVYLDEHSRDLGLLITLLAACNGVAEGLRLVAIFDKDYQKLWRPQDMRVRHDEVQEGVVHVEWGDAPVAPFIHNFRGRTGHMRVEYTLEAVPPTAEAPLKNHVYRRTTAGGTGGGAGCADVHLDASMKEIPDSYKYRDAFYGVEMDRPTRPASAISARPKLIHQPFSVRTLAGAEYFGSAGGGDEKGGGKDKKETPKIIVSTEVNGRTIAQRTEKVPPPPVLIIGTPSQHRTFFAEEEDGGGGDADVLVPVGRGCGRKDRRKESVPGDADGAAKAIKDQNRDLLVGGGGGGGDELGL